MIKKASWIKSPIDVGAAVVKFHRDFCCEKHVEKCSIQISAIGIFNAYINGKRIGTDVLAPGWTSYNRRVQYREYDITDLVASENIIEIELGRGWAVGSVGYNNPYPYMKMCDLYVQPSRYEGNCVCVHEAQMLGKPVVITNYATSASQLVDGVDGIVVPMDNAGCAAGIAALLRDPQRMEQLSKNCRERDYTNAAEVNKLYRLME